MCQKKVPVIIAQKSSATQVPSIRHRSAKLQPGSSIDRGFKYGLLCPTGNMDMVDKDGCNVESSRRVPDSTGNHLSSDGNAKQGSSSEPSTALAALTKSPVLSQLFHQDAPPAQCHENSPQWHHRQFESHSTTPGQAQHRFGASFIQALLSTTVSLMTAVQNVKRNKEECILLMENIHGILYAIIDLHIKSETVGRLPPVILSHTGKFTDDRTLHKIHIFVEGQQDGNKIKYFFRQNEMNTLCKDCHIGLEEALKVFKVDISLIVANNVAEMQKRAELMHQELLELAENSSDGTTSDRASSVGCISTCSGSFSMLPAQPKIFHGRQSELEDIVTSLSQESSHIAILGPGGIGKTSLARAVLHHSEIAEKYEHRFFVAADSAVTSIELAALTGSHFGLKPGKDLTKAVVQFLSRGPPCLLILDNLETSWEPLESRSGVEEFLSLLTDVPHLALIITMRGAERPGKVRWTRPFLDPLNPLSHAAARQTFIEIADDFHERQDIDQLLHLTGNMPLAVDLIAHMVDYEGCSTVLARWETEKTALLSTGNDKQSNLDTSISMSLESPHMTPGAKALLTQGATTMAYDSICHGGLCAECVRYLAGYWPADYVI
ncbi:P-loop containing nucleoside triphosphate hydrolase protein [Mycena epipterygia]|nr:P-loop containing nucleoside triphosphate hydrolase protein [Mycena epipterygia]